MVLRWSELTEEDERFIICYFGEVNILFCVFLALNMTMGIIGATTYETDDDFDDESEDKKATPAILMFNFAQSFVIGLRVYLDVVHGQVVFKYVFWSLWVFLYCCLLPL